jgi:membrane protein required for colicin V production
MNVIDITLVIALTAFVLGGLWFGVIHMIGSLLGVVLGAIGGGMLYSGVSDYLLPLVGGNENLAKLLAFFGLFIIINRLVGLVFWLIQKIFNVLAIVPFLKTFNRLLGAVFGLVEGMMIIGLMVYFAGRFPFSESFEAMLTTSPIARLFNLIGTILAPLLPDAVRAIRSIF